MVDPLPCRGAVLVGLSEKEAPDGFQISLPLLAIGPVPESQDAFEALALNRDEGVPLHLNLDPVVDQVLREGQPNDDVISDEPLKGR